MSKEIFEYLQLLNNGRKIRVIEIHKGRMYETFIHKGKNGFVIKNDHVRFYKTFESIVDVEKLLLSIEANAESFIIESR